MSNLQVGGAAFGLTGEQQSALLASTAGAKLQVGGTSMDGALTPRSVYVRGNSAGTGNLQLGG